MPILITPEGPLLDPLLSENHQKQAILQGAKLLLRKKRLHSVAETFSVVGVGYRPT